MVGVVLFKFFQFNRHSSMTYAPSICRNSFSNLRFSIDGEFMFMPPDPNDWSVCSQNSAQLFSRIQIFFFIFERGKVLVMRQNHQGALIIRIIELQDRKS